MNCLLSVKSLVIPPRPPQVSWYSRRLCCIVPILGDSRVNMWKPVCKSVWRVLSCVSSTMSGKFFAAMFHIWHQIFSAVCKYSVGPPFLRIRFYLADDLACCAGGCLLAIGPWTRIPRPALNHVQCSFGYSLAIIHFLCVEWQSGRPRSVSFVPWSIQMLTHVQPDNDSHCCLANVPLEYMPLWYWNEEPTSVLLWVEITQFV